MTELQRREGARPFAERLKQKIIDTVYDLEYTLSCYPRNFPLSPFPATLPDKLRVLPVFGRSCPPVTPFLATHPKNRGVGVKLLTSAGLGSPPRKRCVP